MVMVMMRRGGGIDAATRMLGLELRVAQLVDGGTSFALLFAMRFDPVYHRLRGGPSVSWKGVLFLGTGTIGLVGGLLVR